MKEAEYLKRLGKHITKVRKSCGFSQDRTYLEGGFSRGTMSKIERGLVNPQITTLVRIAKTLGVPLRKLLEFE